MEKRPLLISIVAAVLLLPLIVVVIHWMYLRNVPPFATTLVLVTSLMFFALVILRPCLHLYNRKFPNADDLTAGQARALYVFNPMNKVDREIASRVRDIKHRIRSNASSSQMMTRVIVGSIKNDDDTLAVEDQDSYPWAMMVAQGVIAKLEADGFCVAGPSQYQEPESDDHDTYLMIDILWSENARL